VHRLRVNLAAWGAGTLVITSLWMVHEWQANGAFERFAHEGNPGDWNPTLWAVVVGLWGLAVGIMALGVHFDRPAGAVRGNRLRFHVAGLAPRGSEHAGPLDRRRERPRACREAEGRQAEAALERAEE
jgi:hypothetical protein